jgi:RND family efflux transporter MFP subunit
MNIFMNLLKLLLHRRYQVIVLIVVILVCIFLIKPFGLFKSAPDNTYRIENVVQNDLTSTLNVSGLVEADNQATMSFLSSGRVSFVGFKEGDLVKKWQVIASLDNTESRQSVSRAEASLHSTQAALDKVIDDIKLWQYGNNNTTGETQTQKTAREQAEMARDAAYQSLAGARKQLEWTTVVAPFDGVITSMNAMSVGQNITPASSSSVTVVGSNSYQFVANVDEIEFANLKLGQSGEVILDAYPEQIFTCQISYISDAATKLASGGSVVPIKLTLPEDPRIKSGLNGEVTFQIMGKQNVLNIPVSALRQEGKTDYVYVLVTGKPIKRVVKTGESLANRVEIVTGLSVDEKIVLGEVKQ